MNDAMPPDPTHPEARPGDIAPAGSEDTAENLCPTCGGSGRSDDGAECPVCAGTGRVIEGVGGG
jgi:hypothetical protein